MKPFAIGAIMLLVLTGCTKESGTNDSSHSLLIAPHIDGANFCEAAVNNESIRNEEAAARFCGAKGETGASRISTALDKIGPKSSPSGQYMLGYTLSLPLMRYFKKVNSVWQLDAETLKANLKVITEVDRPVVVYLSANHFTDGGVELSNELARDQRNLMWTRKGPLVPDDYFNHPVVAWTLSDQTAPITLMRKQVFSAAVQAICELPEASRKKIAAIAVLGEAHDLFPNFVQGPSFGVKAYDTTDYSPIAVRGFQEWLTQKYGKIDKFNNDLGASFASFDGVMPPSKDIHTESLSSFFDHIDIYSAGKIPVYGWINDTKRRDLTVNVILDGKDLGMAKMGLSRTDVTDAVSAIKDPSIGFRFDLDFRKLEIGVHTLEIVLGVNGTAPKLLARRKLSFVDRIQSPTMDVAHRDTNAEPISSDPDLLGYLDGPVQNASAFYNPLAQLWLEYRNVIVRNYIEQFAVIAGNSCIPREKIFSHQITPALTGSWNGDLLAADASKMPDALFNPGTTLYGGAAFSEAFTRMKKELGWNRYSVNEMHPVVKLSPGQYRSMYEMHRNNNAVFLSPYFLSIIPSRLPSGSDLDRFRLSENNARYGSDGFLQSIKDAMGR
ncbi:beta-galactosidase [Variovorax sp. LG9.2]|uniref:beta-galactosidase n=1 Tax=Variovorax sp. LG9.2 TaxID=3048626 RepID=UPI002B2308EF|nr:beta-galactosidase [Variovorax sp. LG9.2]MEB0055547.1 beta-galactosidase [Variovorax sp. LG9.2]